ncbi:hypothetical protein LSTR_LSTR007106 [Laodelphax striatellus]|uniref:RIIa domain-containing protein n=1 Tax=Laodelphax striatellus TaxID=195883 RepID=A0A482WEX6_LAOST|nr:hypothetical protein LSTR_LSTR007106 [Laodelphax striatellus]
MGTISEEMYCSEQINVPLNLPYILKQYAKAAIKTQPRDLLHWSSAYFRALANGDVPPVKDRIEYPLISTPSGLTAGFLRILIKQFGKGGIIEEKDLINKWKGVGLELDELQNMLRLCGFRKTVRWLNFVAVAAGFLSPNLTQTMILICELLTDEPEGGSAAIVYQTFMTLYIYLARMDCGPICHLKSNMADTFSEEVSAEAEEGTTEKSSERLSEIEVALEREPTLDSNDSANGVIMVWEDVTHPDFVQEKTAEENVEDNAADIADIIPVDVVDEATTVVDEEEIADEEETVKSVESYDNTGITLTFHDAEQDVKIDDYTGPIEPKLKKRFEKKLEEEQEGGANEKTDEDKTIMNDEMKENDATKENDNKEGEEEGEQVEEKKNEDEQGVGGGDEKEENKSDSKAGDEVEHKEGGEENENGEKVEGEDEIVEKEGDEEGKGDVGEGEEGVEKETEEEVQKEIEGEMKKGSEEETKKGIEEEVKKETEEEVEKEIEEEVKKETEGEVKKEIEEEVKKETDKKEEKGEGEKTPTPRTKKRKKKQAKKEGEEGETKGEGEEEESDHEEQSRYEYSLELEEEEDEKLEEEKSVKEETVVITEEVEEVKEEEEEIKEEEEEVAEEQVKEEQSIDLEITDSAVALQGQRKSDIQVYGCLHLPKHRRRSVTDSIVSEPDNHFWVHIPGIGPMVPEKQILSLKAYFLYCSEKQGGYVMPRNIKHHLCPSLEPPLEMEKRRSSEVEWINDAVHHDK